MNFYAFGALFVCLSSLLSGALVFWKNPHGQKNLIFQPFAFFVALWSFFYVFWQISTNEQSALLFIRLSVASAAFIPVTNFHAVMKMLDAETPRRKTFLKIFYVITFLLILSAPTQYFIPHVEPRAGFPFWPVPGPMIHIHFINLFIPSVWVIYLIWEKGQHSTVLTRNKLKWLLGCYLIAYTGGMSNNPLWYNIPIKPTLNILSSVGIIGSALTFFHLAVVDFNFLLRKALIRGLAVLLTVAATFLSLSPFGQYLNFLGAIILATILSLVFYPLIDKGIHILREKILKGKAVSLKDIKAGREKIKESTYTYTELARNLIDLVMGTLPVEMVSVYFFDIAKKEFYLCAQMGLKNNLADNLRYNRSSLAIPLSDPLISYAESQQKLLNLEALLNDAEEIQIQPLVESMRRLEGEICAPFIFGEKLRGLMMIGRKKDNRLFNEEELEGILSYSQMGTDVMHTIMAMETELNHTALYSHDINHDIRSITQTLQFLRSPMAKSQGEEKIQLLLDRAEAVAEKLYDSFQMNRDRSALIMKTIRGDYEKKPVQLSNIVRASAGKFSLQAEKSKVDYKIDVVDAPTPVQGNESDLTRVIDNLISNALRHLPESGGRLEILGRPNGTKFEINVKDNGEGIPPEDLDHIWEVGWQAKEGKKGSAGFGLAIVKEIIQVHGGTIEAVSQGKGTGVEFKITL